MCYVRRTYMKQSRIAFAAMKNTSGAVVQTDTATFKAAAA